MSIRATASAARPCRADARAAEQERRDPGGALHPADARRQQRLGVAVLDEPPAARGPRRPAPGRRGCRRGAARTEVVVVAEALPGVEQDVAHAGRAAAASVVVPEARDAAARECRRSGRCAGSAGARTAGGSPATSSTPAWSRAAEQQGRAGRAVAPGVGHRRRGRGLSGMHARHDEPVVAGVRERDQVLGAAAGGVDQVGPVELDTGGRQRGRDPGEAVREVRHLAAPPLDAGSGAARRAS